MLLIAGLGNPDKKYAKNVHNLGFMVIDKVASKLGVTIDKKGHKGLYATLNCKGEKVILIKPQTYMNLSGESIKSAVDFYKIPTENVLVVYDDIDVDKGSVRIRQKGSSGTHNGMKNIILHLGTGDFPRVRVGCKPVDFKGSLVDYVLSDINVLEMENAIEKASMAIISYINGEKFDVVMNKYNG